MPQKIQSFNDGIVSIYSVRNVAEKGNTPKNEITLKVGPLCYEERTVGMGRYWTAMQNNVKVSQIFRMPRINSVSTNDVAVPNDGKQYEIKQVQYPPDVFPLCMDLSLERLVAVHDIS